MAITEFDNLLAFTEHLAKIEVSLHLAVHSALGKSLVMLQNDMKAQIGEYQEAVGPYVEWAPLAETTLYGWHGHPGKVDLGYAPPDNPLLRDGDLRNSFTHEQNGDEGIVGSTDPIMTYHEFGTVKMPARPVVGPALFKHRKTIEDILGNVMVNAILGGRIMEESEHTLPAKNYGHDIT